MDWRPASVEIQEPTRFETQKKREKSLVSLTTDSQIGKGARRDKGKQTRGANNPIVVTS
jgi:hypothetical protein